MRYAVALTLLVAVVVSQPAFAQGTDRAIVLSNAPIFVRPEPSPGLAPLRVAAPGTKLMAFDVVANWLRVQFQDPQYGLRQGYVETRLVRIERAELQPTDLSVSAAPVARLEGADSQAVARPSTRTAPTDQPLVRIGEVASPPGHAFIDLSYMELYPLQKAQTISGSRSSVIYPDLLAGHGADLGASFGSGPVGFGFRWVAAEFWGIGGLAVNIPHPTLANRPGIDADITGLLYRHEQVFDVSVNYNRNKSSWRLTVFGGPTLFHLRQDMVDSIAYNQFATTSGTNLVNISNYTETEVSGNKLGVNGGFDATWYLTRFVGIGGGVRFNLGSMALADPLTDQEEKFRVGSTAIVVGPRFRF
jgi:hypothetical protein